ncbi:MAG: hypothetical protein IANPNBLG_04755 [Bryobacteraceae bacterium]|nr:hypothetical protein [Bryobacteraceae bacterium]
MATQDYKNHARFIPLFHGVLFGVIVLTLIGSLVNLYLSIGNHDRLYSAALIVVLDICLLFLFFFCRVFALKAQDRAIRAEENFRHYLLTGKPFDSRLTIRQIIALRFAPDDEFIALAKRAAEQGTAPDEIKKSVKNWRADEYRV